MTHPFGNSQNNNSPFDHVALHHLTEWRASSVDDQLTALNLLSLSGTEPKEHLFCDLPDSCRRNDGRVRDSWLARYAHTEAGGQWISGLDPHNDWQKLDWGRLKPDEPRIDSSGKTIKYESPPGGKSHVTYFDVPQHIWDKVAKRYRIKRYRSRLTLRLADKLTPKPTQNEIRLQKKAYSLTSTGETQTLSDCLHHGIKPAFIPQNIQSESDLESNSEAIPYCFWEWVKKHPEIPIILTEGEKKAACLLSLGFVAIALPGIWMGRVKDKETGLDYLHPDLMPMVHPLRKFVILFDNDPKPSTKIQVQKATLYTGKVIEAAGATCEVALLPEGSEKGVDDYVTANGKRAQSLIQNILKTALAFNESINNLRDDLKTLLEDMAYNITTVEVESDTAVKTMLSDAGKYLDANHRLAVTNADLISSTEYLARQTKEYLDPEEIVECEKYRIQRDYGMPVTEELVKQDAGGQLISRLILLESLIAPAAGEIIDPKTGLKYPAPPKIVVEKDHRERDNLPLCIDWHNYSSKWLAYHALGFPKLLMRLLAGEEISATDPDLLKMNEIALASKTHIKTILNLTIRPDCQKQPLWLMGVLLDRVGLKTALRKKGKRGAQITYRSLDLQSLYFALEVLQYREQQRKEKAQRERERQAKAAAHQARMQSLYGIAPPPPPTVSTSPPKKGIDKLGAELDTKNHPSLLVDSDAENILQNLQPCLDLLYGIRDLGLDVLKEIIKELLGNRKIALNLLQGLLSEGRSFLVWMGI